MGQLLADAYRDGSLAGGHRVEEASVYRLRFDPFVQAYNASAGAQPFEPDLEALVRHILNSEHLVIFVPVHRTMVPAVLQAFFSRLFQTDSFGQPHPVVWGGAPFLNMRSARIISTLDPESWQEFQKTRTARFHPLKKSVLEVMGFKRVRTTTVPPVYDATPENPFLKKWAEKIFALGEACF